MGLRAPPPMKECSMCGELQDFSEYVKHRNGLKASCRTCSRKYQLKRLYGITQEDYNQMSASQEGCCKICSRHQSQFNRPLFIDHCHTTGTVRGLLCSTCNQVLGKFNDDSTLFDRAASYLREQGSE